MMKYKYMYEVNAHYNTYFCKNTNPTDTPFSCDVSPTCASYDIIELPNVCLSSAPWLCHRQIRTVAAKPWTAYWQNDFIRSVDDCSLMY